jgi:ABC-type antimicrobial peptide transport system permease subunit
MARFYFPHADPLGRHIGLAGGKEPAAIIGVVRDIKQSDLRDAAARRYYLPYLQHSKTDPLDGMRIEIRTQTADSVRRGIKDVDPNLQIQSINAAQLLIEDDLMQERMIAKLSSSFSLLALILASVGLYGVMSYLMQRRTVEVGIRMALGATKAGVVSMVLREALALAGAGLAIGIVVAVFAGKLISSSLYGLQSLDPLTMTIASVVMFAAAVLAGWLPARRAARVDPMVALRAE